MQRRNFFATAAAGLLSLCGIRRGDAAPTTSAVTIYGDPFHPCQTAALQRVVGDAGIELWFGRYNSTALPWIGWLEDRNGKCWGFIDKENVAWQMGVNSVREDTLGVRVDLWFSDNPPRLDIVKQFRKPARK